MSSALSGPQIDAALENASLQCRLEGRKFTAWRRLTLRLLLEKREPTSAYQLLDAMRGHPASGGRTPTPAVVYRSLTFLTEAGLAHRIESFNRFVACQYIGDNAPHHHCGARFLVCDDCHCAQEIDCDVTLSNALIREAQKRSFNVKADVLEVHGRCAQCQNRTIR